MAAVLWEWGVISIQAAAEMFPVQIFTSGLLGAVVAVVSPFCAQSVPSVAQGTQPRLPGDTDTPRTLVGDKTIPK